MAKKTKKSKAAPAPNSPSLHPGAIADLAAAMPWKTKVRFFEVEAYTDAICKLYDRGYSYGEITDWLNDRLADKLGSKKIKRGQVYRVFQQWIQDQREQEDISFGFPPGPKRAFTEEEAEAEAEVSDKTARKSEEKENP